MRGALSRRIGRMASMGSLGAWAAAGKTLLRPGLWGRLCGRRNWRCCSTCTLAPGLVHTGRHAHVEGLRPAPVREARHGPKPAFPPTGALPTAAGDDDASASSAASVSIHSSVAVRPRAEQQQHKASRSSSSSSSPPVAPTLSPGAVRGTTGLQAPSGPGTSIRGRTEPREVSVTPPPGASACDAAGSGHWRSQRPQPLALPLPFGADGKCLVEVPMASTASSSGRASTSASASPHGKASKAAALASTRSWIRGSLLMPPRLSSGGLPTPQLQPHRAVSGRGGQAAGPAPQAASAAAARSSAARPALSSLSFKSSKAGLWAAPPPLPLPGQRGRGPSTVLPVMMGGAAMPAQATRNGGAGTALGGVLTAGVPPPLMSPPRQGRREQPLVLQPQAGPAACGPRAAASPAAPVPGPSVAVVRRVSGIPQRARSPAAGTPTGVAGRSRPLKAAAPPPFPLPQTPLSLARPRAKPVPGHGMLIQPTRQPSPGAASQPLGSGRAGRSPSPSPAGLRQHMQRQHRQEQQQQLPPEYRRSRSAVLW